VEVRRRCYGGAEKVLEKVLKKMLKRC